MNWAVAMAHDSSPDKGKNYSYKAVHDPQGSESDSRNSGPWIIAKKSLWAKICQTWTFELVGFLAGLASLAATIALLQMYDGERVSD